MNYQVSSAAQDSNLLPPSLFLQLCIYILLTPQLGLGILQCPEMKINTL